MVSAVCTALCEGRNHCYFPLVTGWSGLCDAMPFTSMHDRQSLHFQKKTEKWKAGRMYFNSHPGTIRLKNIWPAPEQTKGSWHSSFLWTRWITFLVDCPSSNQLRHCIEMELKTKPKHHGHFLFSNGGE